MLLSFQLLEMGGRLKGNVQLASRFNHQHYMIPLKVAEAFFQPHWVLFIGGVGETAFLLEAPRIPRPQYIFGDSGGGVAVMGMEAWKLRFPLEIEALANFGIRGIIIIGISLLGHFLEQWVIHTLRNQEIYRFLEASKCLGDFFVLALGQFERSDANSFSRFQNAPSITNHNIIRYHLL